MNNDITNLPELPKGWVWTSLTYCSREIYRYPTFYGMEHLDSGIPVIRGEHIKGDATISHDWDDYWFVSPEVSGKFPRTVTEVSDIIMSVRGSVGKIGIVDEQLKGAQVSPNCIKVALFKEQCLPSFVVYYLRSVSAQALINTLVNATTIQTIKAGLFTQIYVPLSPLAEQQRIVAKIEELFTRLDAGVEALKKIKAQLKRYRQSVLKHAFEGKLTQEWRQAHKDELEPASVLLECIKQECHKTAKGKYKDPSPLDTSNLPELPEGWVWARVGDMSVVMGGKRLPKGHQYADVDTGMPYIRVTDFRNMTVDMTNLRFLKQETKGLISKYTISREDLYISIAGSIGKVGTVPDRLDDANLTENAAKITDLHNDKRYMCYVLNSSFCQEQILRLIVSSNQPKLALFRIEQIVFPLSHPSEQHQIVSEIERRFSVADEIEKTVDHSLKQAERLRQSVLEKAFEGKLVPQDPNDEPAEKLLERIRGQRAKEVAEKRVTVSRLKRRQNMDGN